MITVRRTHLGASGIDPLHDRLGRGAAIPVIIVALAVL
jgi:hypothetical protein